MSRNNFTASYLLPPTSYGLLSSWENYGIYDALPVGFNYLPRRATDGTQTPLSPPSEPIYMLRRGIGEAHASLSPPPESSYEPRRAIDATQTSISPPPGLNPIPLHREHEWSLYPPPNWPAPLEWKAPYGMVVRRPLPSNRPRFNPQSMLWWSQWEIVFAKTKIRLGDAEVCSLFRYRWREKDKTTRYMQPYHVAQIWTMLCDGHPWHDHAFHFGDPSQDNVDRIRNEFLADLRFAKVHGY
ncbi:hypothetical protein MMC28_004474 [Mycoblastus sanguinarius]|nr:hypothetical protein [Mycoblastus sanguinarius]